MSGDQLIGDLLAAKLKKKYLYLHQILKKILKTISKVKVFQNFKKWL